MHKQKRRFSRVQAVLMGHNSRLPGVACKFSMCPMLYLFFSCCRSSSTHQFCGAWTATIANSRAARQTAASSPPHGRAATQRASGRPWTTTTARLVHRSRSFQGVLQAVIYLPQLRTQQNLNVAVLCPGEKLLHACICPLLSSSSPSCMNACHACSKS